MGGDVVLALQTLGFEAHLVKGKRAELARAQLPALAPTRSGGLVLVGATGDEPEQGGFVLLQEAGATQPCKMRLSDLTPYAAASGLPLSASSAWCGGRPSRWHLVIRFPGRLCASTVVYWVRGAAGIAFLCRCWPDQPLVFQVVIDKVLTYRTLSTLDVAVIGAGSSEHLEVVLGSHAPHLLSHTTNRVTWSWAPDCSSICCICRRRIFPAAAVIRGWHARELENARNFHRAPTGWLTVAVCGGVFGVMLYYSVTLTLVVLLALPISSVRRPSFPPLLRKKLEDKFALGAENQNYQ